MGTSFSQAAIVGSPVQSISGNTSSNSGTPGGSTTQVQFNNAGTFGGSPGMAYIYPEMTLEGDLGTSGLDVLQMVSTTAANASNVIAFPFVMNGASGLEQFGSLSVKSTNVGLGTSNGDFIFQAKHNGSISEIARFRGSDFALVPSTGIQGTKTNDNAPAGDYGEYVSTSHLAISISSSNFFIDLASVVLSSGDWDMTLTANTSVGSATSWTLSDMGISTIAGNDGTGLVQGLNYDLASVGSGTLQQNFSMDIPNYRQSINANTTYYCKVRDIYSTGQPNFSFTLSARRAR